MSIQQLLLATSMLVEPASAATQSVAAKDEPAPASAEHVTPALDSVRPAFSPTEKSPNERRVKLNVAVVVNGAPAGDVVVETDTAGNADVDTGQLITLLTPVLSNTAIDELRAKSAGQQFVSVQALSSPGFEIGFDIAALQLKIVIPIDARAVNSLSISENGGINRPTGAKLTPPAARAYGVTLSFAQRINHENDFHTFRRDPATLSARGFLNFGGIDGVNVTFLAGLREDDDPTRQRITLFHDDVDRAIRYSLGDVDPQAFGAFGSPSSVLGVGIQRLYEEIQPYRNLRPAGRGRLTIEQPSRVEVLVNGVSVRTLTLGPGQYDLRDFPFLDGVNDVRLLVRDDTGREETIGLSFFSATELLDADISIFSAVVGMRRRRFGEFINTSYSDTPTFNGYFQRGITDRLTVGGSIEADPRNALASGQVVIGTKVGIIGFEAAFDLNEYEKTQAAVSLSYRYRQSSPEGRQTSFDVDLQYRTRGFSPMETIGAERNDYRYDIIARYQADLTSDIYGTFGVGYSKGYDATPDQKTASAGLSRRFGRINLGLNYVYRDDGANRSDHRGILTLSVPLSRRQSFRTSYETYNNRVSADYDLQAFEGLDQTSARVSLARDDFGRSANVELEHFDNRFSAVVRHDYDRSLGQTRQVTDVAVSVGIGYASGTWAVGREADNGFVIVDPHRSLRDTKVTASDSYSLGASARADGLGPALVPVQRGYQPNSITLDVQNAPLGYDIGAGRIDILPGARSGYRFEAGSARSNTVMGRLVRQNGDPVALISGSLTPLSGREAIATTFFTNRTGRLVAQQLAPGRYAVMLDDKGEPIGEVVVPENPDGPVDIGVLTIKE